MFCKANIYYYEEPYFSVIPKHCYALAFVEMHIYCQFNNAQIIHANFVDPGAYHTSLRPYPKMHTWKLATPITLPRSRMRLRVRLKARAQNYPWCNTVYVS